MTFSHLLQNQIEFHLSFELLNIIQLSIDANDDDDDDEDLPSLMTNVRMLEKRPFAYYKASSIFPSTSNSSSLSLSLLFPLPLSLTLLKLHTHTHTHSLPHFPFFRFFSAKTQTRSGVLHACV
jgi:hypothetical protein